MISPRRALIISGACGVLLALYYYSHLPEEMAMHFGTEGAPESFGPRESFLYFNSGAHLAFTLLFLYLPALLPRLPKSSVNLPYKDYWLQKENWAQGRVIMEKWLAYFGTTLNCFYMWVGFLSYRANLRGDPRMDGVLFISAMAIFLTWCLVWIILMSRSLRPPGFKKRWPF